MRPAITSACACERLSARPRSTSSTSSRFFTSRRARCQTLDDVLELGRLGWDPCEPLACAERGSIGACAPPRLAVHEHVAVSIEDVVDNLEQQSELVSDRAPRSLLALGDAGDPERHPD